MHIVTKILIVACALLSLLLSALSISYSANATALKKSLTSERALRAAAEEGARMALQQGAQEKAANSERLQSLENDVAARATEVANLQQRRTELTAELEKARSEAASIKNQIGQLGVTTETQASLIKNYRDEVTTLRDALLAAQKREIELVDRVNELDSAREVLQQNARALKEQLEETKLALQTAQQAQGSGLLAAMSTADVMARELPGTIVRAQVDRVTPIPSGEILVEITEGSNRGIKPNTLMHIVRGDHFVGSLTITAVEPNKAVGRLNTYGKTETAQPNDTVLSRLTN